MNASEYRLAEYQSLREEILSQQRRRDAMMQFGIGVIGLILAWLATHTKSMVDAPAYLVFAIWLMPTAFALLLGLKHLLITAGVKTASSHLALLQAGFDGLGDAGWEKWQLLSNPNVKPGKTTKETIRNERAKRLKGGIARELKIEKFPRDLDKIIWASAFFVSLSIGLIGAISSIQN